MNIYIDLSVISLIMNAITSLYMLKQISSKKISFINYLLLSIINALQILYLYLSFYILFIIYIILISLIFIKIFKKEFISYLIVYLLCQYLTNLIFMTLFKEITILNTILLINEKVGGIIILLYPVINIIIYLMSLLTDKLFKFARFKEEVILYIDNKKYISNAYFDTGNLLLHNNIPVIFMHKKAYPMEEKDFIIKIKVKTIIGEKVLLAKPILLQRSTKKEAKYVYLCLKDSNENFNGCEILLNAYLF